MTFPWASVDCLPTSTSNSVNPKQLSTDYLKHNRSLLNMRSNTHLNNRQNDIKRLVNDARISPQTNSSGYHSDLSCLSSANESPQLDVQPEANNRYAPLATNSTLKEKSATVCRTNNIECDDHHQKQKSNNIIPNKSRFQSFLRRQYEKAKQKLLPKPSSTKKAPNTITTNVTTTTIGTSTSSNSINILSDSNNYNSVNTNNNHTKQPKQYLTSVYQHSVGSEPIYSVYVYPTHKLASKSDYTPIHECYSSSSFSTSQQPYYSTRNYIPVSTTKNPNYDYLPNVNNSSFLNNGPKTSLCSGSGQNTARRVSNYYCPYADNFQIQRSYPINQQQTATIPTRSQYSHFRSPHSKTISDLISRTHHQQRYQYTNDRYEHQSVLPPSDQYYRNYIPISECSQQLRSVDDDGKSAFKPLKRNIPMKSSIPSTTNIINDDVIDDKLCDLEVAKYFKNNPNYFDVYNESTLQCLYPKAYKLPIQNYVETLC
ncbi:unnamed protein product [Didymodactylos carnosus]|uniref:Uncharacterized protein n=1 Tax=Didymodactylos carnosus TaxID=1234261 RepID=A0A813PGV8_9BILA|nr:unnamed protein product [Didymodactylos carnosus]CAF1334525.1 unnamed protein product [Didymodactylos carnosus]CAF3535197.1 unnamed protein product [Didymodactylos carnosus]CAF4145935.1 unnamed protein product [Didymodactylos carnosus]